jgi:hypothetical protein
MEKRSVLALKGGIVLVYIREEVTYIGEDDEGKMEDIKQQWKITARCCHVIKLS